jgi:hypothetical protein
MDISLPDAAPDIPHDPERAFVVWALDALRELVAVGIRTAHRTENQHILASTRLQPKDTDFALMQERTARSVRLSIAMASRMRDTYLQRKPESERKARVVHRRLQARREVVARVATAAIEADPSAEATKDLAALLRERLTEREFEDELDGLPVREVLVRIHHLLGLEPDQTNWPKHWPDEPDDAEEPEAGIGDGDLSPDIEDIEVGPIDPGPPNRPEAADTG